MKSTSTNINAPKQGEPITESWVQNITDAANRSNLCLGYNGMDGTATSRQTPYVNPLLVRVNNSTADTIVQYGILKLTEPRYIDSTPYPEAGKDSSNFFKSEKPAGQPGEEIVIVDRFCSPDGIVPSVISGGTYARVYVDPNDTNAENYKFAKSIANETEYLQASPFGQARIVWKQSGTGVKWAYVVLDREGRIDIYGWLLTADWDSHNNDGSSGETGATPTLATFTDYPPWRADYSSSTANELELYPAEKDCEDAWYYPRYAFVRIGNNFTDGNFRIKEAHVPDLFGWVQSDMTGYGDSTSDEITVKLQTGTFGNAYTIQAYPSIMNKGITVETGTAVLCRWFYQLNKWVVIEAACSPDDDYTPSTGGSTTNS